MNIVSQCTYRCVVLPDREEALDGLDLQSQCTYRCVVLPDFAEIFALIFVILSQCTYRCVVLPDLWGLSIYAMFNRLNAPTGAWCSLTLMISRRKSWTLSSQCTYRCVVLPDPCPRERRYYATSRARSATGPGSTPPDRPAPDPE